MLHSTLFLSQNSPDNGDPRTALAIKKAGLGPIGGKTIEQVLPKVKRVKDNNGFYEWYSIDNKLRGSGTFRGEAGVLYTAINMFAELTAKQK